MDLVHPGRRKLHLFPAFSKKDQVRSGSQIGIYGDRVEPPQVAPRRTKRVRFFRISRARLRLGGDHEMAQLDRRKSLFGTLAGSDLF